MNPQIAKTLTEQRRGELTRDAAGSRHGPGTSPGWLSRHLPRWHVSWSGTMLSPAAGQGGFAGQRDKSGSSLVIIISAHR